MKKIQISEKFFVNVFKLVHHLEKFELDEYSKSLIQEILSDIEDKTAAMERRKKYMEERFGEKNKTV